MVVFSALSRITTFAEGWFGVVGTPTGPTHFLAMDQAAAWEADSSSILAEMVLDRQYLRPLILIGGGRVPDFTQRQMVMSLTLPKRAFTAFAGSSMSEELVVFIAFPLF
jgi:hypothetical protein